MERGTSSRPVQGRKLGQLETRATAAEWTERLQLPGAQGGVGGKLICFSEETEALALGTQWEGYCKVPDANRLRHGQELRARFRLVARRLPAWKAWPSWSIPSELLRVLLCPNWKNKQQRRAGVGAATEKLSNPTFYRMLQYLFAKVASTGLAPFSWRLAQGCGISQQNGKAGCDGESMVVLLCCMGRPFYRTLLDSAEGAPAVAYWAHGCVKGRRRESAILIQCCAGWRLTKAGFYVITRFYDATNAFWSLEHRRILSSCEVPFVKDDSHMHFIEQRAKYATIRVSDKDNQAEVIVGSDIMPGDHAGPRL